MEPLTNAENFFWLLVAVFFGILAIAINFNGRPF
jgi:hypothetical protein